jgi:hypothetical protein
MANIKLQGNPSGSGSVTLTAPNTNSARTITLPDQDMDLGSLAGAGSVQAWATFAMNGTARITASAGISSLSDLGVGLPQFNLSNALAAANGGGWACPSVWSDGYSEHALQTGGRITSTTAYRVYCGSDTTSRQDWYQGYAGVAR